MDVIVLAGGKGNRVAELTENKIPKILLPVSLGMPFIEHLIQVLLMRGCYRICFSVGHLGDQIEDYVTNTVMSRMYGDFISPTFVYDNEYCDDLGTGGGLLWAASYMYHQDEPVNSKYYEPYVLVINGDSILFPGACDLISVDRQLAMNTTQDFLKQDPDVMLYTAYTYNDGSMGLVETYMGNDQDCYFPGRITGFKEKKKGKGELNLGWYIIKKDLLLKESIGCYSLEYDLFPHWLNEGKIFENIEKDWDDWYEIGAPKGIERYIKYISGRTNYKFIFGG